MSRPKQSIIGRPAPAIQSGDDDSAEWAMAAILCLKDRGGEKFWSGVGLPVPISGVREFLDLS